MKLFTGPSLAQYAKNRAQPEVGDAGIASSVISDAPSSTYPAARDRAQVADEKPASADQSSALAEQAAAIAGPASSGVRLVPIPRLAQGGRWRVEAMRSLSEPMLLWFTRGQGRITVAGVTRGYGAHNAVFIPAGTMHGFEIGQQVFGTAVFFGADTDVTLPSQPRHLRVRDAAPQNELSGILDNIQREMDAQRPAHQRAARHHLGLLGVWLERQVDVAQAEDSRPDAARRLVARYTELLERDYASGRSVADYADALGVTPTHLTRVCNQTCARAASELLHDRVLFEARRLLSDTELPVNRIAISLGFTSPAYFTRAFQMRTGKTPTAFRKAH